MSAESAGDRSEGFRRVCEVLAASGHPHPPVFLETAARTAQEAADVLGVQLGQIAKSVVFRRVQDSAAVLVVTSGDLRVEVDKVAHLVGPVARADADFVKASTGFSIGGVSIVGHLTPPVMLIDRELLRFNEIWAAAGHPHGVFKLNRAQLLRVTGAPLADVTPTASQVVSPCVGICRMDASRTLCEGCLRTLDEIMRWSGMNDDAKRGVWRLIEQRQTTSALSQAPS